MSTGTRLHTAVQSLWRGDAQKHQTYATANPPSPVHLEHELERCQVQLQEESAKREKSKVHILLLKSIHLITCALEELSSPDVSPDAEAACIRSITQQTDQVQQAVRASGGVTSLGLLRTPGAGGRGRGRGRGQGRGRGRAKVPDWSGIDASFVPAMPFLTR